MADTEVKRVGEIMVDVAEAAGQFAVDVDGEIVTIWSLPPGAFERTSSRTGWSFFMISAQPLQREDVVLDVVKAAYAKLDKPLPPLRTIADVYRRIVEVPGDLPELPEVITLEVDDLDPTPASSTAG